MTISTEIGRLHRTRIKEKKKGENATDFCKRHILCPKCTKMTNSSVQQHLTSPDVDLNDRPSSLHIDTSHDYTKKVFLMTSYELMCRRDLSDRPQLVIQYARARHTTLSAAIFTRQTTVKNNFLSVNSRSAKGPGRSYASEREKHSKHVGAALLSSDLKPIGEAFSPLATYWVTKWPKFVTLS